MKPGSSVYRGWIALAAVLVILPIVDRDPYHLHILVLILIWSFVYTSWSMMGRFGLTSLGHGGFMGVGAYVTALLWNHLGLSPWLGIPIALVCAGALALVVAYPCFRFRITGHYFALVTLALSGIVLQVITASRDYTGGSQGYTPQAATGSKLVALQSSDKTVWYFAALAVWALGLLIWFWVDRSMARHALEAISEDEDAAAAAGVNVTAEKLKITVLSALMTALAGAVYCQYQMFISPDTVSGIAVSLQMVFAAVVGGLYVALGPTVGAVITILLAEVLRIGFGTRAVGWDNLIYGALLVAFIIFLPKGILGSALDRVRAGRLNRRATRTSVALLTVAAKARASGTSVQCGRSTLHSLRAGRSRTALSGRAPSRRGWARPPDCPFCRHTPWCERRCDRKPEHGGRCRTCPTRRAAPSRTGQGCIYGHRS
jgi:branched-chain amino acid transport system permease protein